jgi:hypothetical protein
LADAVERAINELLRESIDVHEDAAERAAVVGPAWRFRARWRKVQRFEPAQEFTRQIVVLTRHHPKPPPNAGDLVENILF